MGIGSMPFPMRQFISIILAALFVCGVSYAGAIKDGSLQASSDESIITISWVGDDETGVTGYTVERRAGLNGSFIMLTSAPIRCEGRGHVYSFEDASAFRVTDNVYQYRITAIGTNATYLVTVTHTVSSVRRTWGSIKAMFR